VLELLWLPFAACLVLAGIHAYLGLHVLARGVIFADLALAQVAALGTTAALLAGHSLGSPAAYQYSLAFTVAGAAVFALTGRRGGAPDGIPHEAIIGIVYAVAAAGTVLVLDRVAQGGEQIKQMLVGSILTVGIGDVLRAAALYAAVGAVHWLCRRPLLALSLAGRAHPGAVARVWDFVFYLTFGIVVVSSVRIAGVLLVFSYLIVPAVIGALLTSGMARRLAVAWSAAGAVSVVGLSTSYWWDLPTGAAIVATFGAALLLVALGRGVLGLRGRIVRDGGRALSGLAMATGALVALAGAMLMALPTADHLWLDALEWIAPPVRTTFLTSAERATLADSQSAAARGAAELTRLRAMQGEVQWGTREMPPDAQERLRQFLAGRGELVAGDQLVMRTLRQQARARQRFILGPILLAAGGALVFLTYRAAKRSATQREDPLRGG
jgi:zinc/manganese transport system permease protein